MATKRKSVTVAVGNARRTVTTEVTAKPARRALAVNQDEDGQAASSYFANVKEKAGLKFVSSGCSVLDSALGGGWVLGRVVNIVGDKSAGKTLLAIEACANFHQKYPEGKIRYNEAEAAFDEAYAEALGMPVGAVDFKGMPVSAKDADKHQNTIEGLHADLVYTMDQNKGRPILYIIDSLDALSDDAEQGREIGDSSYGGSKPKKLGEMFRRLVERMEEQEVLFIVISQLRDKLNVTFGEKQTRSGGRALDFYASHIVWLAETGKIKRTMGGVERIIGVNVRARVKKNKVGLPFRECAYPIIFGYGIDDLTANVEWLLEVGREEHLKVVGMSKAGYKVRINSLRDKGGEAVRDVRQQLNTIVAEEWRLIETGFLPKSRKY